MTGRDGKGYPKHRKSPAAQVADHVPAVPSQTDDQVPGEAAVSQAGAEQREWTQDHAGVGKSHTSDVGRRLSSSTTQPGYSYHTHRTPVLSIADITGIPPGQGLYYGPRGWDLITLNPWWRQREHLGL